MRLLVIAVVTVALATPARAEEPATDRSETTAVALSVGGTVASYGLLVAIPLLDESGKHPVAVGTYFAAAAGAVLAPSFGHWYAGERWTRGMTYRALGLGTAAAGGLGMIAACLPETCGGSGLYVAGAAAIAGGALFLAGTVHDLATARDAVRARNARIVMTPTVLDRGGGLAVAGTF